MAAHLATVGTAAHAQATDVFLNSGGNWDLAANWSGGFIPGLADWAQIIQKTVVKTAGAISVSTLELTNGSNLEFAGSNNTLTATSFLCDNTGLNLNQSNIYLEAAVGADLKITSGTTMSGRIGTIGTYDSNSNKTIVENDGTINSNVSGNTTTFSISNLTNVGAINGSNGASLTFSDSNGATNNAGATISLSGGTLTIGSGGLTNAGTLTIANSNLLTTAYISGSGSGVVNLNNATVTASTAFFNAASVAGSQLSLLNGSTLYFKGSGNVLSTTSVTFGNTGVATNASNLTIDASSGSDLTIASGTTLSGRIGTVGGANNLVSNGTFSLGVNGNTTTFSTANLTNNGSIAATNSANLTFSTTNAMVNSSGDAISLAGGGLLTVAGGGVTNNGTLTVNNSSIATTSYIGGSGNTLLNSATVSAGTLYFSGTNVGGSLLTLVNGSTEYFKGNSTLSTASLVFSNTAGNTAAGSIGVDSSTGSILTIGSGTTVTGHLGSVYGSNSIVNNGTFNLSMSGSTSTFNPTTLTSNGSITASGGANLAFTPGTSFTNNSTVSDTGGGNLTFSGATSTNGTNGSISFDGGGLFSVTGSGLVNNGSLTIANSSIVGGSISGTGTTTLNNASLFSSTALFNGQTVNGSQLNLTNGSTLEIIGAGNTLATSTVSFNNTGANTTASKVLLYGDATGGSFLTIGSGATLSGNIGSFGYYGNSNVTTLVNNGTIDGNVNGTTSFLTGTFMNNGTINASGGGALSIGTNFVNNGSIVVGSGATISGNTISGSGTTVFNGGSVVSSTTEFAGTTISGSQLNATNGASLEFFGSGNTLSTSIVNFNNTGTNTAGSRILLYGDQSGGSFLTIGSSATLNGNESFTYFGNSNVTTLINNGAIDSNIAGTTSFANANFINYGTVNATNGGSLRHCK